METNVFEEKDDPAALKKISGALNSARNSHPEINYAGFIASIAKRVAGALFAKGAWRVEAFGEDGECYGATFWGRDAEARAKEYASSKYSGATAITHPSE